MNSPFAATNHRRWAQPAMAGRSADWRFFAGDDIRDDCEPAAHEDDLVLQHSSGQAPFFAGPGQVLRFDTPATAPAVLVDCFTRPTAMLFDERSGTLYVAEYLTGRVVAMQL
jgi:hypothetical protein